MTFGHTITLWCSGWRELRNYSTLFQMKAKLVTQIFSSAVRSYKLYFLVTMILNFTLKFFELFKCFRLVLHQVDIPIYAQIISEGQKITIPAASLNTHRSAYISIYDFQQVSCSLHCSGERSFSHLAHEAWFASIKWFIIDEGINTIVTPTTPAAIHTWPITRARAR